VSAKPTADRRTYAEDAVSSQTALNGAQAMSALLAYCTHGGRKNIQRRRRNSVLLCGMSILLAWSAGGDAPTSRESVVFAQQEDAKATDAAARRAAIRTQGAATYAKYCVACHGANGEGHVTENANSLRSPSFLSTVPTIFLDQAVRYGRPGTAMAAYHVSFGGPLTDAEMAPLVYYLRSMVEVPRIKVSEKVDGDVGHGKRVYEARCESCHGQRGKGLKAPSLNDPLFLLWATPGFIRHAISEGREGTAMVPFRQVLTAQEIDDVTVYIRSWAKAWVRPHPVLLKTTSISEAVLHPNGPPPQFPALREGYYLPIAALKRAMDSRARFILLDTRSPSRWAVQHVPGAVPLPYYDVDAKASSLPNDGTWIVAYCECPTHVSQLVVDNLRKKGFKNTAVLDEGLAGWIARRFPLDSGLLPESITQQH
jgi:cytochrome c oxidase cbb3-type subunit III